jgi:type 1 fimbriae regulatory protein FimE
MVSGPSELITLRWNQIALKAGTIHVSRIKHGSPSMHPLRGPELRALRAWKREQSQMTPYVFTSLRGGPMTRRTVHQVVAEAGKAAGIEFLIHPLQLLHACGFKLPNEGQARGRFKCTWDTGI